MFCVLVDYQVSFKFPVLLYVHKDYTPGIYTRLIEAEIIR